MECVMNIINQKNLFRETDQFSIGELVLVLLDFSPLINSLNRTTVGAYHKMPDGHCNFNYLYLPSSVCGQKVVCRNAFAYSSTNIRQLP